jgi:hypothetical protein
MILKLSNSSSLHTSVSLCYVQGALGTTILCLCIVLPVYHSTEIDSGLHVGATQ